MKTIISLLVITLAATACADTPHQPLQNSIPETPAQSQPEPTVSYVPQGYQLVWSDEFDNGTQLDPDRWTWENWEPGHVNHELQAYRPGNYTIDARHTTELIDGSLAINCFRAVDGHIYSGRVNARSGDPTQSDGWRYGYFEARIKLPKGRGTWPAFWMMPADVDWSVEGWPACGEIDIMEEVGVVPDETSSSLHSTGHNHVDGTQITAARMTPGAETDYHIYSLLWTPERITTYVDGQPLLDYPNDGTGHDNWPYDRPFHVILNLAWGGDWGGMQGTDPHALPVTLLIDYLRIYQLP